MKTEVLHHRVAYFLLCLGLAAFVLLFLAVWPNRVLQRFVVVLMSLFYFIWGVSTHVKTASLTPRVAAEYAAVSAVAGGLLFFTTF